MSVVLYDPKDENILIGNMIACLPPELVRHVFTFMHPTLSFHLRDIMDNGRQYTIHDFVLEEVAML